MTMDFTALPLALRTVTTGDGTGYVSQETFKEALGAFLASPDTGHIRTVTMTKEQALSLLA